ncbi:MAG: protein kinase domain-containing protein [Promethearchaeota archaeon]
MSKKKNLKYISTKNERNAIQKLIEKYNLQDFNFQIENGHVIGLFLKFKDLTSIPKELNEFQHLEHLDLSRNKIEKIYNLRSLETLKKLNFRENSIKNIENLDHMVDLRELDLSDNKITIIQALYNLRRLEILNLNTNQIDKIEGLDRLKDLVTLKLNRNPIKKIENLSELRQLETLMLAKTKIERELNLALNQIKKIENLNENKLLKILNLNDNKIVELENLEDHIVLEKISLARNSLNSESLSYILKPASRIVRYCQEKKKKKLESEKQERLSIDREAIDKELEFNTKVLSKNEVKKERNKVIHEQHLKFVQQDPPTLPKNRNYEYKMNSEPSIEAVPNVPVIKQKKTKKKIPPKAVPIPNPEIQPVLQKNYKTEEEWLNFANELLKKEDYRNALLAYRNVIQLNTYNINAWISSGVAFNNRGDYRRSIRSFKQALAISSKNPEIWMYLGIGFFNTGDYQQSVNALNNCIDLDSKNTLALQYLSRIPKKELDLMKKQSEQREQLAYHAQLVEDQLYDQLTKYSKAYSEIAYSELLPLVYNEPYITDLPSLQHKIRDLAIQNRINIKMFLDHLKFGGQEEKSKSEKEPIVVDIEERFEVKKLLAFTNFSQLWLAEERNAMKLYVLKHIIFKGDITNRKLIEHMALREITLLSKIESDNIIKLVDSFLGEYQGNFGYILQEPFYKHGTLERRIKSLQEKNKMLEPLAILTIFVGLLQAIISVHESGIVHRDIKPSNIIVDTNESIPHPEDVILIDFGIATAPKKITGTDFTIVGGCGTDGFSAPEQLTSPHVGYNADIYAIGATIFFMLTFSKYDVAKGLQIPENKRQHFSKIDFIFPLLKRMLNENPDKRCDNIEELYQITKILVNRINSFDIN